MYINKNGKRTYVGNLSTGTPVYKIELNIEEEIRNLEDEISALKCALWKKNQKLLDLKVKLALQKQNPDNRQGAVRRNMPSVLPFPISRISFKG